MSRALALAALVVTSSSAAQETPLAPAPHQVEAVLQDLSGNEARGAADGPRVVINLGSAEDRPWPDRDRYSRMTLIGSTGVMAASLDDIVKVCDTLCGDEAEECHYEAHLVPAGDLGPIGTPLAAWIDDWTVTRFTPILQSEARSDPRPAELSEAFVPPIWPEENPGDLRQRFVRTGAEFTLEYAWGTSGGQTVPVRACVFSDRGPLTRMVCNGVEALVAGGEPVLVSFPDYNIPDADAIASFDYDERTYLVVRFALKAQTVHGLVVHDGDRWRALFHPRDYALLC